MPVIHVSPLSRLAETVEVARPSHLVTVVTKGTVVARPPSIAAEHHLLLNVSDITAPLDGHVLAGREHVEELLSFVRSWDRRKPMVIHCWAGISPSTAAAYVTLCALRPAQDEGELARLLRAASPSATPNARIVALADDVLGREGRMSAAIAAIGRGAEAFEGTPFALAVD